MGQSNGLGTLCVKEDMKRFGIFILGVIAFTGCENAPSLSIEDSIKDSKGTSNSSLEIALSGACGWCRGGYQLHVTSEVLSYFTTNPCVDSLNSDTIIRETSPEVWQDIMALIDREAFSEVNDNACHLCADGCDYTITITDQDYEHSVTSPKDINPGTTALRDYLYGIVEELNIGGGD